MDRRFGTSPGRGSWENMKERLCLKLSALRNSALFERHKHYNFKRIQTSFLRVSERETASAGEVPERKGILTWCWVTPEGQAWSEPDSPSRRSERAAREPAQDAGLMHTDKMLALTPLLGFHFSPNIWSRSVISNVFFLVLLFFLSSILGEKRFLLGL
ncbi:hypothetical protein RRG08_003648 [Elysia crispata]|uniref:Uncharacterized protein n=1 Tax=Elysia crispata TaxID=231223 RepID=A0AAE1AW71_9GAST|nr:hypothetical protein RRG08_003648 [Elysia crispata]